MKTLITLIYLRHIERRMRWQDISSVVEKDKYVR